MPLPACNDEAGLRELDPKCADRESSTARRTVRQLLQQSVAYRELLTCNCTILGLANLVRCATEGASRQTCALKTIKSQCLSGLLKRATRVS